MIKKILSKIQGAQKAHAPLFFYNTLGKHKQCFELPQGVRYVRMYNCGPTVYGKQHIGNLSMFVFTDILRNVLEYNGYTVKQTINITDFGHLTSDADEGEDKMVKGLKGAGLELTMENMRALGEQYTEEFMQDIRSLGVDTERIQFPRASGCIPAQIALIQTLEEKGYAYRGQDGVYFDTSRFPAYGALGEIDLSGLKEGARVETHADKHNPTDFILWKSDTLMGWDSPWGLGFPGWHIECSAMIRTTLGEQIDIHTGGIEHIPIHHNNEIAQSESATGKRPLSRFWIHRAHVQIDGGKIAKSLGNTVYLSDIIERGFHPLALRYLFLGAHYRTNSNFTWEALEASQRAFLRLRGIAQSYKNDGKIIESYRKRVQERCNDDLDTPGALAVIWEMIKDPHVTTSDISATMLDADRVFGLGLAKPDALAAELYTKTFGVLTDMNDLPERMQKIIISREDARKQKDWKSADILRAEIEKLGFTIEDTAQGPRIFKKQ